MDPIKTSIAPWLTLKNGAGAVEFYKKAFGAVETYHMEDPSGAVVSRLSVEGAEFWISGDSPSKGKSALEGGQESRIRMVLYAGVPAAMFERAVEAGAMEVFGVGEDHG